MLRSINTRSMFLATALSFTFDAPEQNIIESFLHAHNTIHRDVRSLWVRAYANIQTGDPKAIREHQNLAYHSRETPAGTANPHVPRFHSPGARD
jgi:hypothetical protein